MSDDKQLCDRLRVPGELIFHARKGWADEPLMKKILEAKLEMEIEVQRTSLESATVDKLSELQGIIKGLRLAIGIIKQQAKI
jgi:hypothetical protein